MITVRTKKVVVIGKRMFKVIKIDGVSTLGYLPDLYVGAIGSIYRDFGGRIRYKTFDKKFELLITEGDLLDEERFKEVMKLIENAARLLKAVNQELRDKLFDEVNSSWHGEEVFEV